MRAILVVAAVAALGSPARAAADPVVAADPAAQQVTALGGSVVWVSGTFGHQVLMRRTPTGPARVNGTTEARAYRSIDLGRGPHGGLVLTYWRCVPATHCVAYRDDLRGHRSVFRGLALRRCVLSTAPALWGRRAAYGLSCHKGKTYDGGRSGLYVKRGGQPARRLKLPAPAVKFGSTDIASVDLLGTRVAAVAADIYEYAFTESVAGQGLHSYLAAASEGESDEHARGLALGSGGRMWTLVDYEHTGDPNQAVLHRLTGNCLESERMVTAAGPDDQSGFRAVDVAVDGTVVYLVVPGTGVVRHAFAPERPCGPAARSSGR